MKIRKYEDKDFNNIRKICKATCSDEFLLNNEIVLYSKYADYYTIYEKDSVFVATNDNDEAIGYILCCTSSKRFNEVWKSDYKKNINVKGGFFQKGALIVSRLESKSMNKKGYDCHMHIDILEDYQHMGLGHRLVDTLVSYLKEQGKEGLYLGCGASNIKGNSFYKKYGFTLHHSYMGCNIYTLKLK